MLLLFYPNQLIRNSAPCDRLSTQSNLGLLKFRFATEVLHADMLATKNWNLQHNPNGIAMSMKNIFAHEPSNSTGDRGTITAWTDADFQIDADKIVISALANQIKQKWVYQ